MTVQIKLKADNISQQEIAQVKRVANMLMQNGHQVKITWPDQSTSNNPSGNNYSRLLIPA